MVSQVLYEMCEGIAGFEDMRPAIDRAYAIVAPLTRFSGVPDEVLYMDLALIITNPQGSLELAGAQFYETVATHAGAIVRTPLFALGQLAGVPPQNLEMTIQAIKSRIFRHPE